MIWILLIIMQFKHFIADYLLQGKYMLGKFKDTGWVKPLAAHCAVHFLFTFCIAATVLGWDQPVGWFCFGLGLLDFTIHFIMDRIKASPKYLGKYQALSKSEMIKLMQLEGFIEINEALGADDKFKKQEIKAKKTSNVLFWWSLGLDQMIHHLTDILIVFLIIGAI